MLAHHGQALFQWTMRATDGSVLVNRASVGRLGDDGRLTEATGFFWWPER